MAHPVAKDHGASITGGDPFRLDLPSCHEKQYLQVDQQQHLLDRCSLCTKTWQRDINCRERSHGRHEKSDVAPPNRLYWVGTYSSTNQRQHDLAPESERSEAPRKKDGVGPTLSRKADARHTTAPPAHGTSAVWRAGELRGLSFLHDISKSADVSPGTAPFPLSEE